LFTPLTTGKRPLLQEILTVKILNSPRIVEYRHVHMVDIY
jgi:hypothetical protein